jgi:hypothetical protein
VLLETHNCGKAAKFFQAQGFEADGRIWSLHAPVKN